MQFEKRDSGLIVPKGRYTAQILRKGVLDDEFEFENICTNEGLIYLLNAGFSGLASAITSWYMGVFGSNYTPQATDAAANLGTLGYGEFTGYSGGARPGFAPVAAVQPTPVLTNAASRASFTFTDAATLYGAFLISSAGLGANSGVLFSAAQFPASKTVGATDQLLLSYSLTASSS